MKRRFLPVVVATLWLVVADWAEAIPRLQTYMAGAVYSGPRWDGLRGPPGGKDGQPNDAMDALPTVTVVAGAANSLLLGGVELTNLTGPLHDVSASRTGGARGSYHLGYGGGSDHRLFDDAHLVASGGAAGTVHRVPEPGTLILLIAALLILIPILSRKRTQEEDIG